jgi:hypothetical protein
VADFMSLASSQHNGNSGVGNGHTLSISGNRYSVPATTSSPMNTNMSTATTIAASGLAPTGTSGTLLVPPMVVALNLGPSHGGSVVSSAATSPLGTGGYTNGFTHNSNTNTTNTNTNTNTNNNPTTLSNVGGNGSMSIDGTGTGSYNNGTSVIISYNSGHQSLHSGGMSTNSNSYNTTNALPHNGSGVISNHGHAHGVGSHATMTLAGTATATATGTGAGLGVNGRAGALSPISPRQGIAMLTTSPPTSRLPAIAPSTYRNLSASVSFATGGTATNGNGNGNNSVLQSPSSLNPRILTPSAAATAAMAAMAAATNNGNGTNDTTNGHHMITSNGGSFTPIADRAQSPASVLSIGSKDSLQRHILQLHASHTPIGGGSNSNNTSSNNITALLLASINNNGSPAPRYHTLESKLNATLAHWPGGGVATHFPSSISPLRTLTEGNTEVEGSRSGMMITTTHGSTGNDSTTGTRTPTSVNHHTTFNAAANGNNDPSQLPPLIAPPLITSQSIGSMCLIPPTLISPMITGATGERAGGSVLSLSNAPPLQPSSRILVVDDSVINVKLAVRMLRQLNKHWIVDTAVDGKQGFLAFQANRYDLVFMVTHYHYYYYLL